MLPPTAYIFLSSDRLRHGVTGCHEGSDLPPIGAGILWTKLSAVPLSEEALEPYVMCPAIALKRLRAGQTYVVWAGAQIIEFPRSLVTLLAQFVKSSFRFIALKRGGGAPFPRWPLDTERWPGSPTGDPCGRMTTP